MLHRLKDIFYKDANDDYDFINDQFNKIKQVQTPVSGLSHKDNNQTVDSELTSSTFDDAQLYEGDTNSINTKHIFTLSLLTACVGYIFRKIINRN